MSLTASAPPTPLGAWVRGAGLAMSRLEWRRALSVVVTSLAVAALGALLMHNRAPLEAPGQSVGLVLRWVVPLSTFAVVSLLIGRARVDDRIWSVAAHGLPKRHLVVGLATIVIVVSAVVAVLTTAAALVVAYGSMPGLATDLATSSWIAALAGAAYAVWFILGASFLRLGRGRWVPLIADFILGESDTVLAVIWPRPHLDNLAGGAGVLDISQPTSSVLLAAMTLIVLCLAAIRAGD